jgi:hypothetical protein
MGERHVFSVGLSLMGLAVAALIRSGTGLDAARLQARREPEWLAAEWVSKKDLNGD